MGSFNTTQFSTASGTVTFNLRMGFNVQTSVPITVTISGAETYGDVLTNAPFGTTEWVYPSSQIQQLSVTNTIQDGSYHFTVSWPGSYTPNVESYDDPPISNYTPPASSSSAGSGTGGTSSSTGSPSSGGGVVITTSMATGDFWIISEQIKTNKDGPVITAKYAVPFSGTFDSIYIYQNLATIGLPDYGDYLTGTSGDVYVSDISADIADGSPFTGTTAKPSIFIFTAVFSPITAERYDLPPTGRPAILQGGGIELTEVRRVDVNGNPIINSVGDYYEGLPEFYIPGSEFTVSWNTASNPASLAKTYSFSTNKSSVWGQDAYSGVIGKITYENVYEVYAGIFIEYWRITVPFRFRNDGRGWNFQPLDYGYRYNDSGTVKNYVDQTTGVYGPVFLDGNGGLLNGDGTTNGTDAVIYPASSNGSPAGYKTLTDQDWSGIGVPLNPFS